jgi:hypothetical protein
MVRSTGSQPRVIVKRRGSKCYAADAESPIDRDASRRDLDNRDDRSLDPGRDRQAPVLAQ